MIASDALPRATTAAVLLTVLFATASIAGFQIALGLAVIGTGAAAALGLRRPARTGLERPALLLAAWAAVMIPFSADPAQSFKFFGRFYLYLALWTSATWLVGPRRARTAAVVFIAGAALYFVFCMAEHVQAGAPRRMDTAHGAMTGGGLAMIALLTAAPFALSSRVVSRLRVLAWIGVTVFGAALVMTVTRSAILGTACGLLVLMILLRSRVLLGAAVAVVLGAAGYFLLLGDHHGAARFDPDYVFEGSSTAARVDAWRTGLEILREQPLTGRGDCDMKHVLIERRRVDFEYDFGHVHDNLIQIGAIWGLPGVAAALWLFVAVFARLVRRLRIRRDDPDPHRALWAAGAIAAWAAFHVAGVFEWYFGDADVMATLFTITGIALAADAGPARDHSA